MIRRLRASVADVRRRAIGDTRAVAMVEFALVFPIVLLVGMWGIELANLALVHLRVSQYALTLADNAARVGDNTNLSLQQLREGDINDVMRGAYLPGQAIGLTTYGRITLSSLENTQQNGTYTQVIHWQRCIGLGGQGQPAASNGYDSSYGTTTTTSGTNTDAANAGTPAPNGIGDANYKVNAPQNAAVMFVEVNYQYQPIFGALLLSPRKIHYTGAFPVRNARDLTRVYNPSPAVTLSTCNRYSATAPTS